jgi:hypothetical protein
VRLWIPIAVGLFVTLGCSGLAVVEEPVPVPVPAPLPDPDPQPKPAAPASDPFAEVDGWIGHAVELEPGERWWVPRSGGAVVAWDAAPWVDVRPGASFVGLTGGGPIDLVFTGVTEVGWCSGTRAAATFSATVEVAAGAVWIVKEVERSRPLAPRESRRPTAARRLFAVPPGVEVDLQRGRTVVERGGGRPWVHTWDGGGSLLDVDLVGPMWPELALARGDDLDLLFRVHEPEQVRWEWVRIEGRDGRSLGRATVDASGCGL